ncbi:unnamed protein product [Haemonchus placei]|uniref:Uncharacterized protein n=1 Tax=Haemonchus placei TaxID=6290 RepID=A0A0N4VXL0_HAEPC|nr:unnamed protein product [Haemonchus placei]
MANPKLCPLNRKLSGSKKANYSARRGRAINHRNKNFSIEDFLLMKNDSEELWDFANGSAMLRAKRTRTEEYVDEGGYEHGEGRLFRKITRVEASMLAVLELGQHHVALINNQWVATQIQKSPSTNV